MPRRLSRLGSVSRPAKSRPRVPRDAPPPPSPTSEDLEDFRTLYTDGDDETMDMTKLQKHSSRRAWIIGSVVALVILAGGAIVSVWWSQRSSLVGNEGFSLRMTADDRIASGDVMDIEISYLNKKSVDIIEAEFELFTPEGFHFEHASIVPTDANNRVWNIGRIPAGTGGKIRITGQLVGGKNEEKTFSGLLTFVPENFRTEFQENASTMVVISNAAFQLAVDMPSQVQTDEVFTVKATVTNNSPALLKNAMVVINAPDAFEAQERSPETNRSGNEWRLDEFGAGEKKIFTVQGALHGGSGETHELTIHVGLMEIDNSVNVQAEKKQLIVIVNPELDVQIEAPPIVDAGKSVSIKVHVKNTSDAMVDNLVVELKVQPEDGREEVTRFDPLKKLLPQAEETLEKEVSFSIPEGTSSPELLLAADIVEASVGGTVVDFPNHAEVTLQVRAATTFLIEARYFNDDLVKIGTGPLPPAVNHETTYFIRWRMTTGANPVRDAKITSTLPDTILWKDDATSGVSFDSTTRKVTATQKTLTPFSTVEWTFRLGLSPIEDDLNRLLVLTNDTVAHVFDDFTEEEISQTTKRLTTDLPTDEGAAGKGVVVGSPVGDVVAP